MNTGSLAWRYLWARPLATVLNLLLLRQLKMIYHIN